MIELIGAHYMPAIETDRLTLRRLTMRDARDIFEYSRDTDVARHVLWDAHTSLSDAKGYIRYMLRRYHSFDPASWGIEWRETGKIIGTIGFMWIQFEHSVAEVGYSLAKNYWSRGIMTEALDAVLHHAFYDLRLNRIEALHEVENPASGAVMRKCGMKYEGCMRQKLYNKGRYVDVNLYAILREECSSQI